MTYHFYAAKPRREILHLGCFIVAFFTLILLKMHNFARVILYNTLFIFNTEQVSDIKSALNLFGDDRQSHQAAGDFLYFTAKQKGGFDNREQIKARREVDNVVEGNYDQQQKRGFSMRR